MVSSDIETSVLESIQMAERGSYSVTQRDLARRIGLSLGMTNALLKRLAERGWIKLTRLSARSIRYALTPEGVAEIARRTSGFFKRAARNAELFRGGIEEFVAARRRDGATTLVLAGTSEIDFLFEYVCERQDLVFVKSVDSEKAYALGKRPGIVVVFSDEAAESLGGKAAEVHRISSIVNGHNYGKGEYSLGEVK